MLFPWKINFLEFMDSILSLDLSQKKACAQIVQVDGLNLTVIETCALDLGEALSFVPESHGIAQGQGSAGSEAVGAGDSFRNAPNSTENSLKALVESFKTPWTSSVVLMRPNEILSLNLDLPFDNPKSIEKIVALEVQDRVPFDLDEFLVEHNCVGPLANGRFDVHSSLALQRSVEHVLKLCKMSDIEPLVLTTPAAALTAVYQLASAQFGRDCLIIHQVQRGLDLGFVISGKFSVDRHLDFDNLLGLEIGAVLELLCKNVEQRYRKAIEQVYILRAPGVEPLSLALNGRKIEEVKWEQISSQLDSHSPVASAAALFAKDMQPLQPLVNFRTGRFVYSLKFVELVRGFRSIVPYLLLLVLIGLISLVSLYAFREHMQTTMRERINTMVKKALPSLEYEEDKVAAAIQKKNFELEQTLKDLGSPSHYSPLQLFFELSRAFPQSADISVRSFNARNNLITVEGVADNYSAIDALEKTLKAQKNIYCRVSKEISNSALGRAGSKGFKLEIYVCD